MQPNEHYVSDTNPTYVTGAARYRTPFHILIEADCPQVDELMGYLPVEHRRTDGYGVVLLDSQEHYVHYVGPIEQVRAWAAGEDPRELDVSLGLVIDQWPNGETWDKIIPHIPWNEGNEGIVTEFEHRGGKVVVFEYLEDAGSGTRVPMVAFHCEFCHRTHGSEYRLANHGPVPRRWIAANARKHIRSAKREDGGDCRQAPAEFAEIVTQVANKMHGTNRPVVTAESRCATEGPCAQIRHLRVRAAVKS